MKTSRDLLLLFLAILALVAGLTYVNERLSEKRLRESRERLFAPDWRQRQTAALKLGELGDPRAIDDLIRALSDIDRDVRAAAINALARFGPAPVNRLADLLREDASKPAAPAPWTRVAAAETLARIGEPALPAALELIASESWEIRQRGVGVLHRMGGPGVISPLARAAADPVWPVAEAAVRGLGDVDDPRAQDALTKALLNESDTVRIAAAKNLARFGEADALVSLARLWREPSDRVATTALFSTMEILERQPILEPILDALADDNPRVRETAVDLMGRFGDESSVGALGPLLRDPDGRVRQRTAEALGRLKAAAAVEPLVGALADPNLETRRAAVIALGAIGGSSAIAGLRDAAADPGLTTAACMALAEIPGGAGSLLEIAEDEGEWSIAVTALARVNDPQAVDILVPVLQNEKARLRAAAASALGKSGDRKVADALEEVLADESDDVRRAAALALDELTVLSPEMLIRAFERRPDARRLESPRTWLLWKMAPRATRPLVAALQHERSELRAAAAEALGRNLTHEAVEPLAQALSDSDARVGHAAARALGRIGDRRAVDALVAEMDRSRLARCEVVRALAAMPDPRATESLRWAAGQCLPGVRTLALEGLAALGDGSSIRLLEAAVTHPEATVRIAAVRGLARLGRRPDVRVLTDVVGDSQVNWPERRSALLAIEELKDPAAVRPLLAILERQPFGDGEIAVAPTLCRLGDPRALPAVLGLLTAEDERDLDADEDRNRSVLRFEVAENVGGFGEAAIEPVLALLRIRPDSNLLEAAGHLGPSAVPALVEMLEDPNLGEEPRSAAAMALGGIGDQRAVEPLIRALANPDDYVRLRAAAALKLLKAPEAEDALIAALKDPAYHVHREAAEALGELGSTTAVPQLIDVLRDTSNIASTGAARALGQIKDPRAVPALIDVLDADAPDGNLHVSAVAALGAIGDPAAGETLVAYLPRWPRRHIALGIRDPERIPDLLRLLDDGVAVAAAPLAEMDDPRAVGRLERAYADREWKVICESSSFFITKGTPGSEDVLIEALNRCGSDGMANDFFGSGQPKLREAALRRSRFYSNVDPLVAPPDGPRWGSIPR